MKELEEIVKKYAILNAVQHRGKAKPQSVLGKIIADNPELRSGIKEVKKEVERIVKEINKMSIDKIKKMAEKHKVEEKPKAKETEGLKDLPNAEIGNFAVRLAPNPDGALTLGNARPGVLCDEYAKRYNGKFILRFDDTDPKVKKPRPEFYDWIREDLKWLGINVHEEYIQSQRLEIYYEYAQRLIEMGKAYVCTCNVEEWRKLRDESKPCPCRDLPPEEHLKRWQKMLNHEYKEGEAVLRIKTDLNHPNTAVRDWAAMRIVDNPDHPLVKDIHVWPLYNFASAIDDHLLGITHILRGQEHSTNEIKQRYLYDYLGWQYPNVIILGRFSLEGAVLSKSKIRKGIEEGEFEGWDDPRVGTLRALRRRGFHPQALRALIIDIGVKSSDITITTENLAAYNKKFIDPIAKRFFFVANPVRIKVKNVPIRERELKAHPGKDLGIRKFNIDGEFFIEKSDFEKYKGKEVRLKDLFNIKLSEHSEVTGTRLKRIPKIHWVPANDSVKVNVLMPDKTISGVGELNLRSVEPGDIVQFERFGFVRVESVGEEITVVFSHK